MKQKKISKTKLPIMPKFARTIGSEIIPDPIAVPANKNVAANCFFMVKLLALKKYYKLDCLVSLEYQRQCRY
jgi:hypothetical protein